MKGSCIGLPNGRMLLNNHVLCDACGVWFLVVVVLVFSSLQECEEQVFWSSLCVHHSVLICKAGEWWFLLLRLRLNSPIFPFACARKGFTARQTWTHFTQKKLLPLLHWYNMFTFPEHLQIGIGVKIDINKNSQCHLWGCFPGHNLDQACKAVYNGWNTYVISM